MEKITTNYGQVTLAVVVSTVDSKNNLMHQNKVKVRIPSLHGPSTEEQLPSNSSKSWVSDDVLPWADVMYPVGTSIDSQDPSKFFKIGEIVYIIFTNTSYRRPVIIGTTGRTIS